MSTREKHRAVLCLGSNVEPRTARIKKAVDEIGRYATIERKSTLRESVDITGLGEAYVNEVLLCTTVMAMSEFSDMMHKIELEGGRSEDSTISGKVAIDIDLVVWDNEIVSPYDYGGSYFVPLYRELAE